MYLLGRLLGREKKQVIGAGIGEIIPVMPIERVRAGSRGSLVHK